MRPQHGIEFTEVQYFPPFQFKLPAAAKTVSRCGFHIQYAAFSSRLFTSKRTRKPLFVPVINIGTPTKILQMDENHLHVPFSFGKLPDILRPAIHKLLSKIRDRLKKNRERAKTLFPTFLNFGGKHIPEFRRTIRRFFDAGYDGLFKLMVVKHPKACFRCPSGACDLFLMTEGSLPVSSCFEPLLPSYR